LYESNLVLADQVAAALHGRPGSHRQVTGRRLKVIEEYLNAVSVPFRSGM
jgi:hypothetical protein